MEKTMKKETDGIFLPKIHYIDDVNPVTSPCQQITWCGQPRNMTMAANYVMWRVP